MLTLKSLFTHELMEENANTDMNQPEVVGAKTYVGSCKSHESTILCDLEAKNALGERIRLNLLGLGDVGGITLIGLRLMGGEVFSEIGIYDLDESKMNRWEAEINQVYNDGLISPPKIVKLTDENLFDCEIFAFCASRNVPEVGSGITDVRKYQLEGNTAILSGVVEKAVKRQYKGILAIISDPVDHLCMKALQMSEGMISPDQIKGFGLGVMYARARYLAEQEGLNPDKIQAFGPHGHGLVIANDARGDAYNDEISKDLTKKTETFNLRMREWGYKPFIAPALSSAALSLVAMASCKSHHSTVYIEGVYLGIRNRLFQGTWQPESYPMNEPLLARLEETVSLLKTECQSSTS